MAESFAGKDSGHAHGTSFAQFRFGSERGADRFRYSHYQSEEAKRARENRRFVIDQTLEQLEKLLDPRQFFRLNRAYFAQHDAIQDIIHYTNSRLKTVLTPAAPEGDVLISRERVPAFRAWLER